MIEYIKRFTCDYCGDTTEYEDFEPSLLEKIRFNVIINDNGEFCDDTCANLFLEEAEELYQEMET